MTLQVDPSGLRVKASQISAPWPQTPQPPVPPCGLPVAASAAAQLQAAGATLQSYSDAGQAHAQLLAASLNAAADAYEQVDQNAGEALGSGSPVSSGPALQMPPASPSIQPMDMQSAAAPAGDTFVPLDTAAAQIAAPDQAASLDGYAQGWNNYASQLEAQASAFQLDSANWEGGSADAADGALRKHQQWMQEMAQSSRDLATQAQNVAAAHRAAVAEHPTPEQVQQIEQMMMTTDDPLAQQQYMEIYQQMLQKSEQVRADYEKGAQVKPVHPPDLPDGRTHCFPPWGQQDPSDDELHRKLEDLDQEQIHHMEQKPGGSGSKGPDTKQPGSSQPGDQQTPPAAPMPQQPAAQTATPAGAPATGTPAGGAPAGGAPSGGAPSGGAGGGMPSGGMPGGGMPGGMPTHQEPHLPKDPSLKPAAAHGGGGGGAGGGGGGAPHAPLQPAVTPNAVAPSGPAHEGAGPAAPVSGSAGGAGMGGGMGGMGAMPHGAHGQGGKQARRHAPDEELYKEDRAWTEGVIGNRPRRKETSDTKAPKETK